MALRGGDIYSAPFLSGTPGAFWNEIGGINVRIAPFYGLGKDFKF
jgi:hypothetical protein